MKIVKLSNGNSLGSFRRGGFLFFLEFGVNWFFIQVYTLKTIKLRKCETYYYDLFGVDN